MLCDVLQSETYDLKPTAFPNTPNLLRTAQRLCAPRSARRPVCGRPCRAELRLRSTTGSAALGCWCCAVQSEVRPCCCWCCAVRPEVRPRRLLVLRGAR